MKTIYKILFSICSTFVCTIYSVKSAIGFVHPQCTLLDSCDGTMKGEIVGISNEDTCIQDQLVIKYIQGKSGNCIRVYSCSGTDRTYCHTVTYYNNGTMATYGTYPSTRQWLVAGGMVENYGHIGYYDFTGSCVVTITDCVPCPGIDNFKSGIGGGYSVNMCYIPANTSIEDTKGTYVFKTSNCSWSGAAPLHS